MLFSLVRSREKCTTYLLGTNLASRISYSAILVMIKVFYEYFTNMWVGVYLCARDAKLPPPPPSLVARRRRSYFAFAFSLHASTEVIKFHTSNTQCLERFGAIRTLNFSSFLLSSFFVSSFFFFLYFKYHTGDGRARGWGNLHIHSKFRLTKVNRLEEKMTQRETIL